MCIRDSYEGWMVTGATTDATDDAVQANIVAAGYCMYGAATELVLCFKGQSVQRFALDPPLGEFVHTHSNVTFPSGGGKKIYSCNEGNFPYWDQPIKDAVTVGVGVCGIGAVSDLDPIQQAIAVVVGVQDGRGAHQRGECFKKVAEPCAAARLSDAQATQTGMKGVLAALTWPI